MRDFYNRVLWGLLEAMTWVDMWSVALPRCNHNLGWWRQGQLSKAVVAVPAVHPVHSWLGRIVQLYCVLRVECYKTAHLMMRQRAPSPPRFPGAIQWQWALCASLIATNDHMWRLEVEKRTFAVVELWLLVSRRLAVWSMNEYLRIVWFSGIQFDSGNCSLCLQVVDVSSWRYSCKWHQNHFFRGRRGPKIYVILYNKRFLEEHCGLCLCLPIVHMYEQTVNKT